MGGLIHIYMVVFKGIMWIFRIDLQGIKSYLLGQLYPLGAAHISARFVTRVCSLMYPGR
jgi:hypothetical protein